MTVDYNLWNAIVSSVTLLVVTGAAIAALRQIRQLRAQTTLAGLLKVLDDWRDPEFQAIMRYVRTDLQEKIRDPEFLAELDHPVDMVRHPEIQICSWYEQIGSYMKHGLLDEGIMLDVSASSCNATWNELEPVIMRMRQTRGDALYENFEYMAARGVLFQRAHPNGCYPRTTPRLADLGGTTVFGIAATRGARAAATAGPSATEAPSPSPDTA
ncbi:MAG TPA: DUF4760 domain-containing protein [Candidatus Elarobacter sp.]|nr:DUF4760 domain-containing protein [Candidatus Elarobacter sp.]